MSEHALIIIGALLLGIGVFVGMLASWDAVAAESTRQWRRYSAWADDGIDRLHLPLQPIDIAIRHLMLVCVGWILGVWLSSVTAGIALAIAGAVGPKIWMKHAID